jgi:hypothetical protein
MRIPVLLSLTVAISVGVPGLAIAGEALASNPAILSNAAAVGSDQPIAALEAHDLIGRDVTNPEDATIGEIESVYVDAKGNVRQVIVAVGGFLGVAERGVALDWKDLVVSDDGKKIALDATKDQLAKMPAYSYAKPSQRGTVFADAK